MDMFKIMGVIMILAGCMGLGLWYSGQFRRQIQVLKNFCYILELFLGEIRYGRCTLPECCLRVSERVEEPYKKMLSDIYMQSCENRGESFGEVCEAIWKEGLSREIASKEDKILFMNCFARSGYEEDIMQLRVMEQAKTELEKKVILLEAELASRCRLAFSLGTMSGLLLVILLW